MAEQRQLQAESLEGSSSNVVLISYTPGARELSEGCMWHFLKVTSNKGCQPASLRLRVLLWEARHCPVPLSPSATARAPKLNSSHTLQMRQDSDTQAIKSSKEGEEAELP